jgi:hypothetical protein
MADRQACGVRPPAAHPQQQMFHVLATAGSVVQQVGAPLVDIGPRDVAPRTAVPATKVHLDQQGVDSVHPAPGRQHAADISAALQRRGDDLARQAVPARKGSNAVSQPLGLSVVHRQIGAADAPTISTARPRMAPDVDREAVTGTID